MLTALFERLISLPSAFNVSFEVKPLAVFEKPHTATTENSEQPACICVYLTKAFCMSKSYNCGVLVALYTAHLASVSLSIPKPMRCRDKLLFLIERSTRVRCHQGRVFKLKGSMNRNNICYSKVSKANIPHKSYRTYWERAKISYTFEKSSKNVKAAHAF